MASSKNNGAETLEAILERLAAGGTEEATSQRWSLQRLSKNPRTLVATLAMLVTTTAAIAGASYSFGTVAAGPLLAAQLDSRAALPLVDKHGRFLGLVPGPHAKDPVNDAFAPVVDTPEVLRRAALALEDRNFLKSNWPCRIDLASTIGRVVLSAGSSAGSGIALQTAKQLAFPEADEGVVTRLARKVKEYGRACGISTNLDANAALDLYLAVTPMIQGSGTTRGAESAARILYGRDLKSTSAAEQLLLAAAIKRPVQKQRPGDAKISCGDAEALTASRRSWCRTVDRARYAAKQILQHEILAGALRDLDHMEQVGPVFATTGAGNDIDADPRIVNPVVRARLLLSSSGIPLERLREDGARAMALPLRLGLDIAAQRKATMSVQRNLESAEKRGIFCVPIVAVEVNESDCGARTGARAAVLAVEADAFTGEIERHIAIGPIGLETTIQLGSLSKLVGAFALAKAGIDDATLVCPRALVIDGKVMRRAGEEARATGVADGVSCQAHHKSIAEAIGTSDNLAFYDALGLVDDAALREAAEALDVKLPHGEKARFSIAFGTIHSTPGQAIEMLRRLAQAAGLLPHYEPGLRFVALDKNSEAQKPVDGPVLEPAKAKLLATLLKAPVSTSGGTLKFARDMGAYAGKTGTTTISVAGHRYDAAKYAVMLSRGRKIGFFAITGDGAPLGASVPLSVFKSTLAQII